MDTEVLTELTSLPIGELSAEQREIAEKALRKVHEILGLQHPGAIICLDQLARHYEAQSKFMKAETIYRLVLAIRQRGLPKSHPDVIRAMANLADFYCARKRCVEAATWYDRLLELLEEKSAEVLPQDWLDEAELARLYVSRKTCVLMHAGQFESVSCLSQPMRTG